MRRLSIPALIVLLFMGCSGSGGSDQQTPVQQTPIPAAAAAMDSKLTSDMDSFMPRVARFEGNLVGIFNPGTPLAQGVALTPGKEKGDRLLCCEPYGADREQE